MLREAERKDKAFSIELPIKKPFIPQVTQADTARQILMNATRTHATTVPASMVWRPLAVSVNLDTQADSVRPISMSVLASPAETVAPVRTVRIPTFVAALKAPQVTKIKKNTLVKNRKKNLTRQYKVLFVDLFVNIFFP